MCGVDEDVVRYREVKEERYKQPTLYVTDKIENKEENIFFLIVLFLKNIDLISSITDVCTSLFKLLCFVLYILYVYLKFNVTTISSKSQENTIFFYFTKFRINI